MRPSYLRAAVAGALFAVLTFGTAPLEALRARSQNEQQKPQQKPPVTVPGGPAGEQKQPDQYTLSIEVPLVTLDVVVADDRGDPITGLKKGNFRVSEDGVLQPVTNFSTPDAPITCVILVEFSTRGFGIFAANATYWGDEFVRRLRKDDWVALVSYDMRTRMELDFTQDKLAVENYLSRMYFPGFSESNLFDALMQTLDDLKDVKGRKSILLLASGVDTFSRHTLDDAYKRVKDTDVAIFPVGVARALVNYLDNRNLIGGATRLNYYQAENQLREFARLTGGRAYFPQFEGEIPGIMQEVAATLRSQYSLGYTPTNQVRDGKYRKIKVDVIGADGAPIEVHDQKGKKLKIVVYARQGYVAPKGPIS